MLVSINVRKEVALFRANYRSAVFTLSGVRGLDDSSSLYEVTGLLLNVDFFTNFSPLSRVYMWNGSRMVYAAEIVARGIFAVFAERWSLRWRFPRVERRIRRETGVLTPMAPDGSTVTVSRINGRDKRWVLINVASRTAKTNERANGDAPSTVSRGRRIAAPPGLG